MAIIQNWIPEDSGYIELKVLLGDFGSIGIRIRCSVRMYSAISRTLSSSRWVISSKSPKRR